MVGQGKHSLFLLLYAQVLYLKAEREVLSSGLVSALRWEQPRVQLLFCLLPVKKMTMMQEGGLGRGLMMRRDRRLCPMTDFERRKSGRIGLLSS